jgi:hypothetical protein
MFFFQRWDGIQSFAGNCEAYIPTIPVEGLGQSQATDYVTAADDRIGIATKNGERPDH